MIALYQRALAEQRRNSLVPDAALQLKNGPMRRTRVGAIRVISA